jgi:hypothetical protein
VRGNGSAPLGGEEVSALQQGWKVRGIDRNRLEPEAAHDVARQPRDRDPFAWKLAYMLDAARRYEAWFPAMAGEHRFDTKVGGEIVPKILAATHQHPRDEVPGRDALLSREPGEIGERAVRLEMIVLARIVEVGVAGANRAKPVCDARHDGDAEPACAHRRDALSEPSRMVGWTGDSIGPCYC